MTLSLSKRSNHIVQSEIRNMSVECDRVGGINLSQGVCDTEVPLPVRRGAQAAIDDGFNSYTRFDGLSELRAALSRKLQTYTGLAYDPDTEIVASAGSTGAFYCACLALLDEGDEVILFEPFYGYHVNTVMAVGAVPSFVQMRAPEWTFSASDLERVLTPRTRGIMINTPGNPTGKVWSRAELERVGEFARKHELFVFTDEIYEHFLYDGRAHVSPASIPGLRDQTILISGLSKTFSITGWRIGYAACADRWAKMIGYMSDLVYVCPPAPLQLGVARGLDALPPEYYQGLCAEYRAKRDRICDALDQARLSPVVPQGAYYVLADLSRLEGSTSKDRCMTLLRKTGVASVPGSAFHHDGGGDRLARFCFAKTDDVLADACRRLAKL
jgi:aminotransferase